MTSTCADLVVVQARITTMDEARPEAEAMAVRHGRVAAVGRLDEVLPWRGPRTAVLDARGARVLPGFVDSHMHLWGFGQALQRLALADARSTADLAAAVRAAARSMQGAEDAWIIGNGWDEARFTEQRLPTRHDLDAAAPRQPVLLYRHCLHIAVANTAALRAAGLWAGDDAPIGVEGGIVDLDDAGHPTGVLREAAVARVAAARPQATASELRGQLVQASAEAARWGVTTVHSNDGAPSGFPDLTGLQAIYAGLARTGELAVRVWWDFPVERLDEALARGWVSGMPLSSVDGPDAPAYVQIGSAKIFTDGSLGGHTAALFEPYADRPDTSGLLLWEDGALETAMRHAFRGGVAVCAHAIGDRAAEQVITAVQGARRAVQGEGAANGGTGAPPPTGQHASVRRPRLIHCQIMRAEQWPRMATLGVVAEVQPRFVASDIPIVEARVGALRAATSYAWRSIAAAGVQMAFGSDCPVEPVAPMEGVYAAVARQTMDGLPAGGWLPDERLSVHAALWHYTRGGAAAVGMEGERGRLAPGWAADFVLLDADPYVERAPNLASIRPLATYMGGRATFRAAGLDAPDGRFL